MRAQDKKDKPLLLVTLCGGGWHPEMHRILERFEEGRYRYAYAYGHNNGVHGAAKLPMPHPGPRYPIHFLGPTRKHPIRFITNTARFVAGIFEAFAMLRRVRPDVVLALGTATAIPLCLAGKCMGIRCVFVESLTRVEQLSLTGRILYHLRLADRLYVQWENLLERFGRATYEGAVV